MKTFDWEFSEKNHCHSPIVLEFLKKTQNSSITEESFVEKFCALPKFTSKSERSPSNAKYIYRSLKKKFGFFTVDK